MSETRGTDTDLLSVSIMAGPAANALLARMKFSPGILVEQPAGANPNQIIERITRLAAQSGVDGLIIQCEPERPPMAYASLFAEGVAKVARLETTAFAIEVTTFLDSILDRVADSVRACFMTEQIEFVDRIVFDDGSADFDLARSIALALNPHAQVSRLLEVDEQWWQSSPEGSFDFNAALARAGWRQLLDGEQQTPAADNRVTAIGYSARRPGHPERFSNFIRQKSSGVFRAKGFFWLASRMDEVGGLNLAGADLHCSSAGSWWATRDARSHETEMPEHAQKEWREPFGDRRQALGVMALDVDQHTLRSALDACLLSDAEMNQGPESWQKFPDPFPSWSHHHHSHPHSHEHDGECDHDRHDHDSDDHHCCQH
jgi:G3E family GTPase